MNKKNKSIIIGLVVLILLFIVGIMIMQGIYYILLLMEIIKK